MSVHIQIERFEGPLSLLLHLIRREEMDIFDINIHAITQQYLNYIKAMKKLNLEVAGEFIAMAATLIHIKSRMLLPQYGEDGELLENDDPRKELVNRLLEYQRFQEAGQELYRRPLLGRETWARGHRARIEAVEDEEIITEENALFSLISSYRHAIKQMKKAVHKVGEELQSISERILEMASGLLVGRRVLFSSFITAPAGEAKRGQVLVTFLSLLELGKIGFVRLFQSENFSDIHIETQKPVSGDVLQRVEEYDSVTGDTSAAIALEPNDFAEEEAVTVDMTEEDEEQERPSQEPEKNLEALPSFAGQINEEIIEAATDEEIVEEERRMGIEGAPINLSEVKTDFEMPEVSTANLEALKDLEEVEETDDLFLEFRSDPDPQPDGSV